MQIAELYYDKLPQYMSALYQLTLAAIQKATMEQESDDVGQQAVEFWTTICDEELDLQEEAQEAREENKEPERKSHNFVGQGLAHLVPLLLEAMCKQEEDTDDETWNMAMASSTCLAKIALTTADQVVAFVMPFLDKHINSPDWRRREASLQAFGSILEGPRHESLAPYMSQVIDVVIQKMSDPSVPVKDTAAWTIGRICEFHTQSILPQHWQLLMRAPPPENPNGGRGSAADGLKDDPRVAANVCWALRNLADHRVARPADQSARRYSSRLRGASAGSDREARPRITCAAPPTRRSTRRCRTPRRTRACTSGSCYPSFSNGCRRRSRCRSSRTTIRSSRTSFGGCSAEPCKSSCRSWARPPCRLPIA